MAYREPIGGSRILGITTQQRLADERRIERFIALLPLSLVGDMIHASLDALREADLVASLGSPASLLEELASDRGLSVVERDKMLAAAREAERMLRARPTSPPVSFLHEEAATVQQEVMRGLLNGLLLAWSMANPTHENGQRTIELVASLLEPREGAPWRSKWSTTMLELREQILSSLPLTEQHLAELQRAAAERVASLARQQDVELPQGLVLKQGIGDSLLLAKA